MSKWVRYVSDLDEPHVTVNHHAYTFHHGLAEVADEDADLLVEALHCVIVPAPLGVQKVRPPEAQKPAEEPPAAHQAEPKPPVDRLPRKG